MKNTIEKFIADIYSNLNEKCEYFWPTKKGGFPHENNISLSIAEIASKWKLKVYSECNMNESGARRDLILVCEENKWTCQVEVKFQQNWDSYEEDFWRVSVKDDFFTFLKSDHRQTQLQLDDFSRYGLFIAGGKDQLYNWWNNPTQMQYEWLQSWFNDFPDGKIMKGIWPKQLESRKFGLVYYLISVTEENTVEWINNL
ncbi:MAG: hypothetical protein IPJ66_10760 [Bacteroidetes bacterium]|nr:hypothetical protein [Bacteroidota bacterium]MBL0140364.1 hypothetical protein [Bacteroidota bacterium]